MVLFNEVPGHGICGEGVASIRHAIGACSAGTTAVLRISHGDACQLKLSSIIQTGTDRSECQLCSSLNLTSSPFGNHADVAEYSS
eukprot:3994153-Amphidinium_carterae.1